MAMTTIFSGTFPEGLASLWVDTFKDSLVVSVFSFSLEFILFSFAEEGSEHRFLTEFLNGRKVGVLDDRFWPPSQMLK